MEEKEFKPKVLWEVGEYRCVHTGTDTKSGRCQYHFDMKHVNSMGETVWQHCHHDSSRTSIQLDHLVQFLIKQKLKENE